MDTTTQPRVSKITIGRLHNLGNYEHVRYEITVEVPEANQAAAVLVNLENVLERLDPKPPVSDYDLKRATVALAKPVEEWPEWERDNEPAYLSYLARHKEWSAGQEAARLALNDIGGTTVYVDAKDKWED